MGQLPDTPSMVALDRGEGNMKFLILAGFMSFIYGGILFGQKQVLCSDQKNGSNCYSKNNKADDKKNNLKWKSPKIFRTVIPKGSDPREIKKIPRVSKTIIVIPTEVEGKNSSTREIRRSRILRTVIWVPKTKPRQ